MKCKRSMEIFSCGLSASAWTACRGCSRRGRGRDVAATASAPPRRMPADVRPWADVRTGPIPPPCDGILRFRRSAMVLVCAYQTKYSRPWRARLTSEATSRVMMR